MFLMTKPCSFCITINSYIEHSCGQFIAVATPRSELSIPVWLRQKGARILPKVPKASLREPAMDDSTMLTQLMAGGRNHHCCWAGSLWEGTPAIANLSILWEGKPSLIITLIIKRKLSKWGHRTKVYKFWKQNMIFQEFYFWVELNDTIKKEKYRTLFCPKVCNHTIHNYISYFNTKN